jgi:hypothetical protein
MKFEPEPYQRLFTWTIAFSIFEPFVALVSYLLSVRYGMKTMYQLYPNTSPFLIVVAEYVYMTIVFAKAMYFYKHVLKKPTYYPRKGETENYRDFILLFVGLLVIIDIIWAISIHFISAHIPFLDFLRNYSKELGFFSLVRPIIVGITLVLLSDGVMQYANDLEGIGAILFSVFVITIASF